MFSHAIRHLSDTVPLGTEGLPYDAEVEYLEGTGTQYISTGLSYFPDFEIELQMRTSAGNVTLGTDDSWKLERVSGSNPVWQMRANGKALVSNLQVTQRGIISYRDGVFLVNDGYVGEVINLFQPASDFVLFSQTNRVPSTVYPCMIYRCKCWDANGNLVRDFIPVRVGTEYCLYDQANPTGGTNNDGLYHNAGSGDFSGGSDKVKARPRFLISRVKGFDKPYDAEVEYIESTGTQYIDTNLLMPDTYSFGLTFEALNAKGATWILFFGWRNGSYQYQFNYRTDNQNPGFAWDINSNAGRQSGIGYSNTWYTVECNSSGTSRQFVVNNSTLASWTGASQNTSTLKAYLFASNVNGTAEQRGQMARVSRAWIKDENGNLVRDLIAVRVGTEYCLYDRANPTGGDDGDGLYHNKGTGNFLGGSDIRKLKPILKHYDIATSYTIHECNGNSPTTVNVNFPSDKYTALNYTPTWAHHRFLGWYDSPYDAEVEYLENDGTRCVQIDSVDFAPGLSFYFDFQFSQTTPIQQRVFRWGNTADNHNSTSVGWVDFYINSSSKFVGAQWGGAFSSQTGWSPVGGDANTNRTQYQVSYDGVANDVIKNGDTIRNQWNKGTLSNAMDPHWLRIFGDNSNPNMRGKIYSFKWLNSDATKTSLDVIPVRVGSNGYFFDKISKRMFGDINKRAISCGLDTETLSVSQVLPTDNIVLNRPAVYARWQDPTTVTFDATTNGGQMPSGWTTPDYYEGQPYGTLPTPTHATLNFTGWYLNGSRVSATDLVQANATLVAQYVACSYSVDISNGDWVLQDPNTNPDTSAYDGVYQSDRYHGSPPSSGCVVKMYIDVVGYTNFKVYIRSYGENSWSYAVACNPDIDPPGFNGAINNATASTENNATSTTSIDGYTEVNYTLDGGSHRICIVYLHKDSYTQGDDRGYVLIPKQQ